jgi:hypothetical protein
MAKGTGGGLIGRVAALLVLGAVAIGGVLIYKQNERAKLGRDLLAEFVQDVSAVEMDAKSHEYVETLAKRFHTEVYEAAFASHEGLTGGRVNVNAYQKGMADRIAAQARADGSEHVAKAMEAFKKNNVKLDLGGG